MIVVLDASTFISAALKANSRPERALVRAVSAPNRLILSQAIENEYREVIFRPKFDRFVSVERRQRILDIVVVASERVEPTETGVSAVTQRMTNTWRWPPLGRHMSL